MTDQQHQPEPPSSRPPPPPSSQPQYGPTAYMPARRRRIPGWLIATAAGVIALGTLGGVAAVVAAADSDTDEPPGVTDSGDHQSVYDDEPEQEPDYYELTKDDIDLGLKVLSKECFGAAGCLVEFRVELTVNFVGGVNEELDPDVTYEVTYEIKGGEDPYINTFTVSGEEYMRPADETISTSSSDAELRAVVLEVSEF